MSIRKIAARLTPCTRLVSDPGDIHGRYLARARPRAGNVSAVPLHIFVETESSDGAGVLVSVRTMAYPRFVIKVQAAAFMTPGARA
jgi:hypothetical protein